jgi:hypothetical protein
MDMIAPADTAEPPEPKLDLASMKRAATTSPADAAKMQLSAQETAPPRRPGQGQRRSGRTASRPPRGQAALGNGSEMAIGTKAMAPFIDTVRERPDMLAVEASQHRMELADKADVLTLGVDAAATIQAANSLEKMLAHQLAAAHAMAMKAQAEARELLNTYKRTGYVHPHLSIEAGRMMNASARMMESFQHAMQEGTSRIPNTYRRHLSKRVPSSGSRGPRPREREIEAAVAAYDAAGRQCQLTRAHGHFRDRGRLL